MNIEGNEVLEHAINALAEGEVFKKPAPKRHGSIASLLKATKDSFSGEELDEARSVIRNLLRLGQKATAEGRYLHSEVIQVTPAIAYILLSEHNDGNRPFSAMSAEKHTRNMEANHWFVIQQGISLSHLRILNNGQHRLFAVLRLGAGVLMNVSTGERREAFVAIDTSMKTRNNADVLTLEGISKGDIVPAVANVVNMFENGRLGDRSTVLPAEVADFVRERPEILNAAAYAGKNRLRFGKTAISNSHLGAAYYWITTNTKRPKAEAEEFFSKLLGGHGLDSDDPILMLRNKFNAEEHLSYDVYSGREKRTIRFNNTFSKSAASVMMIINAWNLWATGKSISKEGSVNHVVWRPSTQKTPPAIA